MVYLSEIEQEIISLGLDDFGVVASGESETWSIFRQWLDEHRQGEMIWLVRNSEARKNPKSILESVRTILAVAVSWQRLPRALCFSTDQINTQEPFAEFAPYSTLCDYHDYLRPRLHSLADWLRTRLPEHKARVAIDTTPLPEKEWACRAGLGYIGRHSLLIHPRFGSRVFLGFLLLSAEPELFTNDKTNSPFTDDIAHDHCGSCRLCETACPAGAILGNGTIDAQKCLNYWTIEYRGDTLPDEVRTQLGSFVFGCDRCQAVCPKNRENGPLSSGLLPLSEIQTMDETRFRELFAGTPIVRCGLAGLKRNAR